MTLLLQPLPAPDVLSTAERDALLWIARRGRRGGPSCIGTDVPRLEDLGLVEFLKETRSGTTWWRATDVGLRFVRGLKKVDGVEEPKTMARVQGTIEALWPRRSYNVWIDGGLRHVAVKFGRDRVEGVASTWRMAFAQVEAQR